MSKPNSLQQPLLKIDKLSKHFRLKRGKFLHAVNQVDLEIYPGEILGLVGESGCGKSTLGKSIVKIHSETSGKIYFKGEEITGKLDSSRRSNLCRQVQMIFQDPYMSLNPRMTVESIISEGPDAFGLWSDSERKNKVCEWLERVGLDSSHINRYPHEFSGGQRQRLGIARALALGPELIVCDEPISALDVSVQAQVINLLKDLQQEHNLTYLFIAHDLSMVRMICDRMAVMYLGNIVEVGPSDQVYDHPQHPYTQALVGANPIPDPAKERARERKLIEGEINSPVNPKPSCLFAPRCPKSIDVCGSKRPELKEVRSGVQAACHLL